MSNTPPQSVDAIFAKLNQRDIEQFYASYQRWRLQQQIATLETRIDDLYLQIFDITERMQAAQPSAIALATLARLQANGVNDLELLDRMLERGENWLDQTMQQLDYCEQLDDFIRDDYTQWCRHALEGAYDWIGSIQDSTSSPAEEPIAVEEEQVEATAELFLQKLNSDEDEDEASMLETTLKRPAVTLSSSEEAAPIPVVAGTLAAAEAISPPGESEPVVEETPAADAIPASAIDAVQAALQEANADVVEESYQVEVSSASETLVESTAEPEQTDVIDDSFTQPPGEYQALQAELEQTDVPIEQESAPAIEETSIKEAAPSIEEHMPSIEESAAEEHVPVSESESTVHEHVMLEESPPVESSSLSDIEQPATQESVEVAPAQEEPSLTSPEPSQQIEEPVPSEAPAAESEKLEANVQAAVPQEGEPYPQNAVVTKRPNFIMRLLKGIWC